MFPVYPSLVPAIPSQAGSLASESNVQSKSVLLHARSYSANQASFFTPPHKQIKSSSYQEAKEVDFSGAPTKRI